jgi:2-oxoglutarate dehydrogenase E2 component (dihydrolipoamide succinyltransferase)
MARVDVIMPQMGESIAEGTISRWMKQAGEAVKRDEPIFEISTDKVDAEIPAPIAGVLAEILVQEGTTVAINTVVARIETDASAAAAAPAPSAPAPAASAPPAPAPAAPAPAPAKPAAVAPPPPLTASVPDASGDGSESMEERLRRRSTPLVRKMVAEHGIDLGAIPGSGMAGRVTKSDVLSYLESGAPAVAPAAPAAPGRPVAPAAAPAAAPGYPAADPWEGDRVEPWSRIRKLTAEHMLMSRRTSAHVATFFDIDYTRITQLRAKKKAEYAERGVNLTFLAFIVKAIADNLRKHPIVNAAVGHDTTIYRRDINVGIAVALEWGLIVPVIKHADELSLLGVSRAINDLAERARTKKLSPDEVQKGTFTITNPGTFGSKIGIPIINQPQTAILAVGSITKQPVVVSVDGVDAIGIRTVGMLSLSFDHRVIDGAEADRFMADVKQSLESFPEGSV